MADSRITAGNIGVITLLLLLVPPGAAGRLFYQARRNDENILAFPVPASLLNKSPAIVEKRSIFFAHSPPQPNCTGMATAPPTCARPFCSVPGGAWGVAYHTGSGYSDTWLYGFFGNTTTKAVAFCGGRITAWATTLESSSDYEAVVEGCRSYFAGIGVDPANATVVDPVNRPLGFAYGAWNSMLVLPCSRSYPFGNVPAFVSSLGSCSRNYRFRRIPVFFPTLGNRNMYVENPLFWRGPLSLSEVRQLFYKEAMNFLNATEWQQLNC